MDEIRFAGTSRRHRQIQQRGGFWQMGAISVPALGAVRQALRRIEGQDLGVPACLPLGGHATRLAGHSRVTLTIQPRR